MYTEVERSIISLNPMYKGSIDLYNELKGKYSMLELYSDYSGKEEDMLAIIYYKVIVAVYNRCKKLDDFSYLDELLSLKKNSFIQDFLKDGNNWRYFVDNVKAARIYDNDVVYFYKIRFVDFITNYIMEDK